MRPRYERPGDVRHQERLMRLVATEFYPLPVQYRLDYFVPQPLQVWEVKRRGKKYATWMVSLSKLIAARSFEACGLEAWALIEIAGDVYKMRFTHTPVATIAWGGRQDRGDPQDMEPVVHYSLDDLKPMSWTLMEHE